jgi:hypothetical protein
MSKQKLLNVITGSNPVQSTNLKNMNKIKAIEMHIHGFSVTDISLACDMSILQATILINQYHAERCVTVESKINTSLYLLSCPVMIKLGDLTFESKSKFANFLEKKYGYKRNRTLQRLRRGSTPSQCLLNEQDYKLERR